MPLTHLLRLCCSQCLLKFLFRDTVAVWVFLSVCQAVPPLEVAFARLHVCHEVWPLLTEVLAGSAAVWHGGQLYRSGGKPLTYFRNTSNLSSIKRSRWGMSTMTSSCCGAGLSVSRHLAGRHMAYYRSSYSRRELTEGRGPDAMGPAGRGDRFGAEAAVQRPRPDKLVHTGQPALLF